MLANGFGLGLSPVASGTVGSLPGILIALIVSPLHVRWQILICIALALIAIPICGRAEEFYGKTDDGRIVADEYVTFPICLIGLPWVGHLWLLPVAFVVNRVLDIVKPPPAFQAQNLIGGVGIVMDDVISSIYALGINHAIWYVVAK